MDVIESPPRYMAIWAMDNTLISIGLALVLLRLGDPGASITYSYSRYYVETGTAK